MLNREFESEIAVKIAMMESSDVARLAELRELAVHFSAKAADNVSKTVMNLLVGRLSHLMDDVLELGPFQSPQLGGQPAEAGYPNLKSADAAAVVQCLSALTYNSALDEHTKIRPDLLHNKLKNALEALIRARQFRARRAGIW